MNWKAPKVAKGFHKRTLQIMPVMQSLCLTSVITIILVCFIVSIFVVPTEKLVSFLSELATLFQAKNVQAVQFSEKIIQAQLSNQKNSVICDDPVWCSLQMPKTSFFKFNPPTDVEKWQMARIHATQGNQILLYEISKVLQHHFDFLDGDVHFRKMHYMGDVFVDEKDWLSSITKSKKQIQPQLKPGSLFGKEKAEKWQREGKVVTPREYDIKGANRSPIVHVGYHAFDKNLNALFSGNNNGAVHISLSAFLEEWKNVKDDIEYPFVTIRLMNENWGWFSSHIPSRTANWGECCDDPEGSKLFLEFLNHDKTLMVVVNQHTNISHPKVLSLPRGVPSGWEHNNKILWDAMRSAQSVKKDTLLFALSSMWHTREKIIRCVSQKFEPKDFDGHILVREDITKKHRLLERRPCMDIRIDK